MPQTNSGDKFEVHCRAGDGHTLHAAAESLSIQIGQRVFRDGEEQTWHSLGVYAREDDEGNLVIRVLIFNPDWEEPLRIASITSRPSDRGCATALECNLDHVMG